MSNTNANNVNNVTTGKPNSVSGAVFWAPYADDLTMPTDATTALAAAFKQVGYISEDGVTNNIDKETESIKAWGGDIVLVTQTGQEDKFTFKMIEGLNDEVLKTIFGSDNVTVVAASGNDPKTISVAVNMADEEEGAWVINMVTRGNNAKRIVIPRAMVTELGEIAYTDADAIGYEVTLTAMKDSSGNTHYEYMTA